MAELLLELLSEEIPARMQARAAADLRALVTKGLGEAGLTYKSADAFATPRRLALVVRGLPERSSDQTIEKKGPRVDAPPAAIDGFLRSTGLKRDQLEERDLGNAGRVLFAVQKSPGRAAADVLTGVVLAAIQALPWPKSMRWAANPFRWVRPLHGVLALVDGKVLQVRLPLGEGGAAIPAGHTTVGHRVLGNGAVAVTGFDDYVAKLRKAYVILDPAERKRAIQSEGSVLAAREGLRVRKDDGLLDEVAGLVEWPVPLIGAIDPAFMDLPPEVLTTSMRTHQRYFALEAKDGTLAPRFLVIANTVAKDGGAAIIKGNERVLRARLSDAKFFWDHDRKVRLDSRLPALKEIVFQAKLGTLEQRVSRIEALAAALADLARLKADKEHVRLAARLAKADLKSGMVGEFPELQGIMGRYYALHDGHPQPVADAIAEHYAPKGPDDRCPSAPVSVAVALAEKIDTLAGFWAIDEKPTGSKDPFALRRAALGVIRLVVENKLRLPLAKAFDAAMRGYAPDVRGKWSDALRGDLLTFFADRLKVHLKERGVRHDLISAVFALTAEDDLVRLLARVEALQQFLASEDGADLLVAYRRAANIVRIEEKKDSASHRGEVDAAALQQGEERTLTQALGEARKGVAGDLAKEDFADAMRALARLRGPVDAFFDNVTVNADDAKLRANRLRLLGQITAVLEQVADFAKIEG
ncbi:MAG: glycine--tRNA ligase subunit beta [Alphaproteobacteria bacterium]|nr:glycine--tRNA ligase subunit beta [Alphaproteobacteria bacterium]